MPAPSLRLMPVAAVLILCLVTQRSAPAAAEDAATPTTETAYEIHAAPCGAEWQARVSLDGDEAPVESVELNVFGAVEILGVEADGLAAWELISEEDDAQTVALTFRHAPGGPVSIVLRGTISAEFGERWTAPRVQLGGAVSRGATLALWSDPEVRVRVEAAEGLRGLDGAEREAVLRPIPVDAGTCAAYSVWQEEFFLECLAEIRRPRVVAAIRTDVAVSRAGADLTFRAQLDVTQADLFAVSISLPAEWEPTGVTRDGRSVPWTALPVEAGVHRLHVDFARPLAADSRSEIALTARRRFESQPLADAGEELAIPDVRLHDVAIRDAVLAVEPSAEVLLSTRDLAGLEPTSGHAEEGRFVWQTGHAAPSGTLHIAPAPSAADATVEAPGAVPLAEAHVAGDVPSQRVVGMDCTLTSRFDGGGEAHHRAEYALSVRDADVLVVKLPQRGRLVAAAVDGHAADALIGEESARVALPPAERRDAACTLSVEFVTRGEHLDETDRVPCPLPELSVAGETEPIEILRRQWKVELPEDVCAVSQNDGVQAVGARRASWLGCLWTIVRGNRPSWTAEPTIEVGGLPSASVSDEPPSLPILTRNAVRASRWAAASAALLVLWTMRRRGRNARLVLVLGGLGVPVLAAPWAPERWLVWLDGVWLGSAAGVLLWVCHRASRPRVSARQWHAAAMLAAVLLPASTPAAAAGESVRPEASPRLFAQFAVDVRATDTGLETSGRVEVRIVGGAAESLRLVMPADQWVDDVWGAEVASWTMEETDVGRALRIQLRGRVRGATNVSWRAFQALPWEDGETPIDFVLPQLDGAERASGSVTVHTVPGLAATVEASADSGEPAAGFDGDGTSPSRPPVACVACEPWPDAIPMTVARAVAGMQATLEHTAHVERHRVSMATRACIEFAGAPRARVQMFLPEGFEPLDIRTDGLGGWSVEDGLLSIDFDAPRRGSADVFLTGVVWRDPEDTTAEIAVPLILDVADPHTTLRITCDESIVAEAPQSDGWATAARRPPIADKREPVLLVETVSPEPAPITFGLGQRKPEISGEALTELRLTDARIDIRLSIRLHQATGDLRWMAFTAPVSLAETLRLDGIPAERTTVHPVGADRVRWVVRLPEPAAEGVVVATATLPVEAGHAVEAPGIELETVQIAADGPRFAPIDAPRHGLIVSDESRRYGLEGARGATAWQADSLWSLAPSEALGDPVYAALLESGEVPPQWTVQPAGQGMPPVAVESADVRVHVADDGTWRLAGRYCVRAAASEPIVVRGPHRAQLLAACVNGRPAEVARRRQNGHAVLQIGLPDDFGSDAAWLDLVWSGRFDGDTCPASDDWKARHVELPCAALLLPSGEPATTLVTRWSVSAPRSWSAQPVGHVSHSELSDGRLVCERIGGDGSLTVALRSWPLRVRLSEAAWIGGWIVAAGCMLALFRRRPRRGALEAGASADRTATSRAA